MLVVPLVGTGMALQLERENRIGQMPTATTVL